MIGCIWKNSWSTIYNCEKKYEQDFIDIIKSGIASDEIINSNAEIIMFSILSTLRSLYLWIPKKEAVNANDLAETLSKVLINGINK